MLKRTEKPRYTSWFTIILAILTTVLILSCDTESTNPYETNSVPEVDSIIITASIGGLPDRTVLAGDTFIAYCITTDAEDDPLDYDWWFDGGEAITGTDTHWTKWIASDTIGSYLIGVNVFEKWIEEDYQGNRSFASKVDTVQVVSSAALNKEPIIYHLTANPQTVLVNDFTDITCDASDPDGLDAQLTYTWHNNGGAFTNDNGSMVTWRTPDVQGIFKIIVGVSDSLSTVQDSINIEVTEEVGNQPPIISRLTASSQTVLKLQETHIICEAIDPDGNSNLLTYYWATNGGTLRNDLGTSIDWKAPDQAGFFDIVVDVSNGDRTTSGNIEIEVTTQVINVPPEIERITADPEIVGRGDTLQITCTANDRNGDILSYGWSAGKGTFLGTGSQVGWIAPVDTGSYFLKVTVSDDVFSVIDSSRVWVAIDTGVLYFSDFSSDDVTGKWTYVDSLAGISSYNADTMSIKWDENSEALSVLARSYYGTYGFRMNNEVFSEGTFTIKAGVKSLSFGRVAFIPKFVNADNYFLIGLNFFTQEWHIIYCVNGITTWPFLEWKQLFSDRWYEIGFVFSDGSAKVMLDGVVMWEGVLPVMFQPATHVGVGVYGLEDSGSALFDDLKITNP